MIKIENTEVTGWEAAVRGMRNPMNSWDKSDTYNCYDKCESGECPRPATCDAKIRVCIGENDMTLMKKLASAGSDHGKFLRMINVTADITAPLYWWSEYDTYKVGTVANSCSKMHKIAAKEFTLDDFSHEHLYDPIRDLRPTIDLLNSYRELYLETKDKDDWWQMIQLLPSSYNQRRTVQLNYEVLRRMYYARRNHKLDEWVDFCKWVETLPNFKSICCND